MKIAIPRCMPRCKICKKPLKNSASITKGVGPECATKFAAMLVASGLTLEALGIPESISTDRVVARNLHVAEQALLAGRTRDVERFKTAAQDAARRAAAVLPAAA
jgi:N-acyl-L-homoserine lactone synthetase